MEKTLPAPLRSETLKQLATEQLIKTIIELGKGIEQLKSRVVELEQESRK
jgi:transposase